MREIPHNVHVDVAPKFGGDFPLAPILYPTPSEPYFRMAEIAHYIHSEGEMQRVVEQADMIIHLAAQIIDTSNKEFISPSVDGERVELKQIVVEGGMDVERVNVDGAVAAYHHKMGVVEGFLISCEREIIDADIEVALHGGGVEEHIRIEQEISICVQPDHCGEILELRRLIGHFRERIQEAGEVEVVDIHSDSH